MACELISKQITEEQKGQILGVLSVGCDRITAANFVGCSLADIRRAMQRDATFAADLCRAEASAELFHMRKLQQAAKDEKNWRISVWWLEHHAPDRYGSRSANALTARQAKAFVEIMGQIIRENVHDDAQRQQVLEQLGALAASVNQMLCDMQIDLAEGGSATDLHGPPGELAGESPGDNSTESYDFTA